MAYDHKQQKPVRRRTIPPPCSISFRGSCTYREVLEVAKKHFFPDLDCSLNTFRLADASGVPYKIDHEAKWTMSEFIKDIGVAPSKLRLYIIHWPKVSNS